MQANSDIIKEIEDIISKKDARYKTAAYLFILHSLDYTIRKIGKRRHVSGRELSLGIRDFALEQFGPTAGMVLEHWGLRKTIDFGNIVYNLIEAGLMRKTETDRLEDFDNVFLFKEAFSKSIKINPEDVQN
jgi:uncharacterized repeat protein (TIGR04138 family)